MDYLEDNLIKLWAWIFLAFIPSWSVLAYMINLEDIKQDCVYVWEWNPYSVGCGAKIPKLSRGLLNSLCLNYLNIHFLIDIDSRAGNLLKSGELKGAELSNRVQEILTLSSDVLTLIGAILVVVFHGGPPSITLSSGVLILFAKLLLGRIDIVAKSNSELVQAKVYSSQAIETADPDNGT